MDDHDAAPPGPAVARGDVPAERLCLRCNAAFWSTGFGERICKKCKAQSAWKSASLSVGMRSGRRSAK
ncbi:MAG: hypothetical protein JJT81_18265 [Rubellimicrobium sp.]|nr:hypothetical protein [Rubellimicrobium sp.]